LTFAQHALDRASLAGDLRVRTTEVRLSSSGYCADVCSQLLRLKRSALKETLRLIWGAGVESLSLIRMKRHGEPAIAIVANSACIPIVAAVLVGWGSQ
jgi:hypothetical protein